MDESRQIEYDFFMRMAALAQQKGMELAPLRDDPGPAGKLFRQYIDDMENCKHYARGIKEGFVFVHRDNVPKVERPPIDPDKIPSKYRTN